MLNICITGTFVGINVKAENLVFTFKIVRDNESNIPASPIQKKWLRKPVRFLSEDYWCSNGNELLPFYKKSSYITYEGSDWKRQTLLAVQ